MKIHAPTRAEALSLLAAAGLSAATLWTLRRAWTASTGREPPDNPAERGVTWQAAIAWGAASGMATGLARVFAHRLMTATET